MKKLDVAVQGCRGYMQSVVVRLVGWTALYIFHVCIQFLFVIPEQKMTIT